MVRKMGYDWKILLKNKYYHYAIKLGVSVLLVGLAFRLLYDRSYDFSPVSDAPFLQDHQISAPPFNSQQKSDQIPARESIDNREGQCNLFAGDWVHSPIEPLYTYKTCRYVEDHQNCLKNGRPDTDYLHWRWKPHGCELPRLNAGRFLELMRNKSWAFIGDSISRNHVQSFLCMLSTVENAVEAYHDEKYKNRRWVFASYNFTVWVIWSPLLAEAAIFEDINGVSNSEIELYLDRFDKNWTELFESMDYMVLSTGKWFTKPTIYYENDTVLGCHRCYTKNLTDFGFNRAYERVLNNVLEYIIASNPKGMVFYRSSVPDHFENGDWDSGGACKRTGPVKAGEFVVNELDRIIGEIEVELLPKALAKASEKGVGLRVLDVWGASLLRPDGHPGPYRFFQPFAKEENATVINDCLHWCLPGPIDSWNDMLVEMVVRGLE
ncbi:protein trichome birefringence-like 23 [Andrographis paniculata]|uniref:protein trichome birefringence-like 23 n=1 Tax=Andrographis paniculata TaxID=175694 RepID=UPI0021E80747|nr:protein trichome birefringence-like 23 [Andrographis paniculata]